MKLSNGYLICALFFGIQILASEVVDVSAREVLKKYELRDALITAIMNGDIAFIKEKVSGESFKEAFSWGWVPFVNPKEDRVSKNVKINPRFGPARKTTLNLRVLNNATAWTIDRISLFNIAQYFKQNAIASYLLENNIKHKSVKRNSMYACVPERLALYIDKARNQLSTPEKVLILTALFTYLKETRDSVMRRLENDSEDTIYSIVTKNLVDDPAMSQALIDLVNELKDSVGLTMYEGGVSSSPHY